MNPRSNRFLATFVLLNVTFVWGATFTLTKNALSNVNPYSFLAMRFIIATAFLAGITLCVPASRRKFNRKTWLLGTLLGIFLFLAYILQTVGLEFTSPAKAGFLTGTAVILVPLLAPFVVKRKIRGHAVYSSLAALSGLLLLCGSDLTHFAIGDFLVLLCSVFISLQMLFLEKWGQDVDSLALSTIEIGVLGSLAIMAAFVNSGSFVPLHIWLTRSVGAAILICAIPATALAYYAQTIFQKRITSAQTAVIFSMEPVFAALISMVFYGEILTVTQQIGSVLIFLSMLAADEQLMQGRFNWNLFLHR